MKKFLFVLSAVLFVFTMAFVSCKKTDTSTTGGVADTSTSAGNDHTVAMQSLSDADNNSQNNMSQSGTNSSAFARSRNQIMGANLLPSGHDSTIRIDSLHNHFLGKAGEGDSVSITAQTTTTPGVATMNFGIHGIASADGNFRKGKVINHFMHKFHDIGFIDTISFSNYSLNGNVITGEIILTRTNDSTFTRQLVGIKVTYPSGKFSTHSGTSTRIYSAVAGTVSGLPANLKVKESGVVNGVARDLTPYSATVAATKPLVYDFACQTAGGAFPVSGAIDFSSPAYKTDRIFDFGAGACDKTFTITIGSLVITVNKV